MDHHMSQARVNPHRQDLRIEPNPIRAATIGQALGALDLGPGSISSPSLEEVERMQSDDGNLAQDVLFAGIVHGVFPDDEEDDGEFNIDCDGGDNLSTSDSLLNLQVRPGRYGGHGRFDNDLEEMEGQEQAANMVQPGEQGAVQMQSEKPKLPQQVPAAAKIAGLEIPNPDAYRSEHPLLQPPDQEVQSGEANSEGSGSSRRKDPQIYVPKRWMIRNPLKPGIPMIGFNDLDPNDAFNRMQHARPANPVEFANQAIIEELALHSEGSWDFRRTPQARQLAARSKARNDLVNSGTDSAVVCLEKQRSLEAGPMGLEERDDVRRYKVFAKVTENLRIRNPYLGQQALASKSVQNQYRQIAHCNSIDIAKLAVTMIRSARPGFEREIAAVRGDISLLPEDVNSDGCSFCLYDSDFGVSDSSVWLNSQTFPGYCHECHESSNLFQVDWLETMVERYVKVKGVKKEEYQHVDIKRTRLAELLDLDNTRPFKELVDRDNAARLTEERAKRGKAPPVRKDSGFDFNGISIDGMSSDGNVERSGANTASGQVDLGYQMQTRDERQQITQQMNTARMRSLDRCHQPHSLYQQYSNHQRAENSMSQSRQPNSYSLVSRVEHMTLLHPQPQRQTMMGTTIGGQRSSVMNNGSEFVQMDVSNQPPNPLGGESDREAMNIRGGAGPEDESYEDSDDEEEEEDELPSLPKTPHKVPVSRSDSTFTQPRQTSSSNRRMYQQTPTPRARQQKSSTTGGKRILLAASTIKYELDVQGREIRHEDDEEDDSEDELSQAQLPGKRLFGFQEGSARPTSKLENSRDILATPTPARQRVESSSLMDSNTLAVNKKNTSSRPRATPSNKKREAPSTPNSAETPFKKARRSEGDLEKFELQKLADEHRTILADETLAPAPPRLEGITPNQTGAAIRKGEKAAASRGLPKPHTYGDVVRQGLIDLPELSTGRESRNTEAKRKYRALYGNLYEEQKERFSLQGKAITNYMPWKATKKNLSLPEPNLGEYTYAGSNASNPAESSDAMEIDDPSMADDSPPKPMNSGRASTFKGRSSVGPDVPMSSLPVVGAKNSKSRKSSNASAKKGGRATLTAPSPSYMQSIPKAFNPPSLPSRQTPSKNKRTSGSLIMGPPPTPSMSKNNSKETKPASSFHFQGNDGVESSRGVSGRVSRSGRAPGPVDMASASLSLGQLSIDAKNRPSAISPTSYDEFFAQNSAVSAVNTISQKVRESEALTSSSEGTLQLDGNRNLSNSTKQSRQSNGSSSAHHSQQRQNTPKLATDSVSQRKTSIPRNNPTEVQRKETVLQMNGNSSRDSNSTPYGNIVAQGQTLVGQAFVSVPEHGARASLQEPQQSVAHGNNTTAQTDLSQRNPRVSLPQLHTFARPSGGQSTAPSLSPNISQHTPDIGRIAQNNQTVTQNGSTQKGSLSSTPQYQSIAHRSTISPIMPAFPYNPLSSAPFDEQGNMAESTTTPQSVPHQRFRPVFGSKAAAVKARVVPRSMSKELSVLLQHGQQAGLPRHVAAGNENFAPKNSSNLREYQISSPLAQHPHAHGNPQIQVDHGGYMSHQQPPIYGPMPPPSYYGPIPPAHLLPPRVQSPRPTGIQSYEGILACRGSAYSQIDVTKARICKLCRNVRLAIVHHRHFDFTELSAFDGVLNGYFKPQRGGGVASVGGSGSESTGKKGEKMRRCMVCTSRAYWACKGCPLRICESCKSVLVNLCKGRMNDLLMFLYRVHLRNDAFLLRSDGGGF